MGEFPAAETYFRQSLAIDRALGDPDNPEMAITLQHIGRMAHVRQDYQTSWTCWTEALAIWKRLVLEKKEAGYIHYLASCLHALGEHFADNWNYPSARQNFEQSLNLRLSILPADHPDIAENLANLGRLCAAMEDYTPARMYLKRALPLYSAEFGPDNAVVRELDDLIAEIEDKIRALH
jgi:tetratricopeptide (TPR) repeat protein